ncbi:hypothetical protein EC973_006729 [Apophysomyces ossiformis]|uniref:Galactose oxidase n=1 Tax=Apophysomyces ossiformis TaxID=679940 RepID=A0A8H7ES66_9FUNG|nr:hypothetical protein EC973_006729 [Apophysomyces ossiformis]
MQLLCVLFVLIVKIAHLIVAVEPEGRMCSGCTVLSKTLYCYSGGTWAASVNYEAKGYADFYMLDISHNFVRSGALAGWLNLSNADNYVLEPNWDFSIVNVKGQAFVTNGGIGYGIPSAYIKAKPLVNVTTKFLGEEWSTVPLNNPLDQYWGESGNYVDSKNSIYYWGGWNFHTDTKAGTSFRILDYATNIWSISPAHTLPNNSVVRYQHTATMAGDNNIYFIGGSDGYKNNYNISMNEILVYDTIADTWDVRQTQGSVTPGPRILHTTTWTKNQWTKQDIRGAPGAGERYGHSAVLVGNSTLFILFGIGPNPFDNGQSVFFILDLNAMAWTDYYDASALNYSPISGTNSSHDPFIPPQQKSTNTPTIVGAVVGCVGAVGDTRHIVNPNLKLNHSGAAWRAIRRMLLLAEEKSTSYRSISGAERRQSPIY